MTTAREFHSQNTGAFADQAAAVAYLSQNAHGGWTVRDEADNRGGFFQNRKAALKFVQREFGRDAQIISAEASLRLN